MKSILLLPAPSNQTIEWDEINGDSLTESLGIRELRVTQIAVSEEVVHLKCVPQQAGAVCPRCETYSEQVHARHERAIRDVSMNGKRTILQVLCRRFRCGKCQRPFTEQVTWRGRWRRYTVRYERLIYEQCCQRDRKAVAQAEGLSEAAVTAIFVREAEHRLAQATTRVVRRLGIDEIALKKRHKQYAVVLTDLDRGCVVAVLPERKKDLVEGWLNALEASHRATIEVVSTDLWEPFRQASQATLPQARQVADRFHVMRQLNRRLNQARAAVVRTADPSLRLILKGTRWALVKNPASLTPKEHAKLATLLVECPALRDLYVLKEEFRTICNKVKTRDQAARFLQAWRYKVLATQNGPLCKFISSLDRWWDEFLNYFVDRTTQAFPEGIHNAIRVIIRRAYGFRNFEHFRLHVLAQHGGL